MLATIALGAAQVQSYTSYCTYAHLGLRKENLCNWTVNLQLIRDSLTLSHWKSEPIHIFLYIFVSEIFLVL